MVVVLFIASVWLVGRFFKCCRQPAILGYLLTGILMGPQMLDIVPYASDGLCETPISSAWLAPHGSGFRRLDVLIVGRHLAGGDAEAEYANATAHGSSANCYDMPWERWYAHQPEGGSRYTTSIWTTIGNVGVTLMIFQSGMHIHFDKVAQVGRKAFVVAIFGTALPLLTGMAFVALLWGNDHLYPSGFAAGCAFAPTSIDISIKLLEESKMLNSMAGQTTLTAAFTDDIFSLTTLVMMKSLAVGKPSAQKIIVPLVCSFSFLALGVFLALYVFNRIPSLLAHIPAAKYASVQPRDEVHLFLMVVTLCFFGWFTSVQIIIGSHLLGAFVAGMCFVNVPRSQAIWNTQVSALLSLASHLSLLALCSQLSPRTAVRSPRV